MLVVLATILNQSMLLLKAYFISKRLDQYEFRSFSLLHFSLSF